MHILNKSLLLLISLLPQLPAQAEPTPSLNTQPHQQHRLLDDQDSQPPPPPPPVHPSPAGVSPSFFASLERTARLVDITYCVGGGATGISPPFSCISRCKDFPTLHLVRTWNTGVLLSDSCGYIAVDRGHGNDDGHGDGDGGGAVKEIVVAFRGTYSLTNTIVDLSTVPQEYVPYPAPGDGEGGGGDDGNKCGNCTVHMGFMASWRNAREVVVPALRAAREEHPGYRVHLVGHSLGGAVAALAGLELRLGLGWEDVVVTTFGEPRVGNRELAEYIDRAFRLLDSRNGEDLTYRRVTHVGDPVPLLPLAEWGYRSHAGEVFIGKSDLPPGPEDLRRCRGDSDPECMGGAETADWLAWVLGLVRRQKVQEEVEALGLMTRGWVPARLKLWQLFFAHRDYFWRLGLCVPGGDPADWRRERYHQTLGERVDDEPEMLDL